MMPRVPALTFLSLALVAGCSSCEEEPEPEPESEAPAPAPATPVSDPHLGTITGTVRLAEGFSLPAYEREDVDGTQAQAPLPEECTPAGEDDLYPLSLDERRGLEGVLVAVTGEADQEAFVEAIGPVEPETHEVAIVDCRLQPRILSATRGDTLVVKNETAHPFLPRLGPSSFMRGLQEGEEHSFPLERGGVVPLQCGFGSPCGRTDVVVLYNPVHTISGEGGEFTLTNVPADMPITVRAWHPVYGRVDASAEATVAQGETAEVELVITPPDPPAAEGEASPEDEGDAEDESAEEQPEAEGGEGSEGAVSDEPALQ